MFGFKKKVKKAPGAAPANLPAETPAEVPMQTDGAATAASAPAGNSIKTTKANSKKQATVREPAFSFEASRISMLEKSERRAWACAKGIGIVSICLAGAIWIMSPLKQGVPYVFQVDKYTGQSTLIRVADPQSIPRTELMDKYWVTEYIRSRETYDYNTVDAEFRRVREMTMADQFGPYMKQFQGEQSLDRVLGPAKMIRIEILSVGIEGDGIARVRFIRRRINTANMAPESESYWTATVGFQYMPNYTTAGDRLLINPFGFKVTSYRLDQEFTRGSLALQPEKPVERELTPKEQYDLPPLSDERTNPAPIGTSGENTVSAPLVTDVTAPVTNEAASGLQNPAADSASMQTGTQTEGAATVPLEVRESAPTPAADAPVISAGAAAAPRGTAGSADAATGSAK